jgi:hypothetical protein
MRLADSPEFAYAQEEALPAVCVERCLGQRLFVCALVGGLRGDCQGRLQLGGYAGEDGTPAMENEMNSLARNTSCAS